MFLGFSFSPLSAMRDHFSPLCIIICWQNNSGWKYSLWRLWYYMKMLHYLIA